MQPFINERNRLHELLIAQGKLFPSLGMRPTNSLEQNLQCLRQGYVNLDAALRNHSKDMSMVQQLKKDNKALKKDINQIEKDLGAEMAERQRLNRQINQFKLERTQREESHQRELEVVRRQHRAEISEKTQRIADLEREQESKIQRAKEDLNRIHRVEMGTLMTKNSELQEQIESDRVHSERQRTLDQQYFDQKLQAERKASQEREAELTLQLQTQLEAARSELVRRDHTEGMADPELEEAFELLRNAVREAARVRWDRAKAKSWPFPETTIQSVPNPRKLKQQIVQASMWAILFEDIFSTPFKVFAQEGATWQYAWTERFGTGT